MCSMDNLSVRTVYVRTYAHTAYRFELQYNVSNSFRNIPNCSRGHGGCSAASLGCSHGVDGSGKGYSVAVYIPSLAISHIGTAESEF